MATLFALNMITSTTHYTPGAARIFAAFVYDLVLLIGLVLFAATLMVMLSQSLLNIENPGASLPFRLVLFGVIAGFYLWFWTHGGQTLGMRAWRLEVITMNGAPLTLVPAINRLFAGCLSCLTGGLGIFLIWFGTDKRTLHDRLAGTRLILREKTAAK